MITKVIRNDVYVSLWREHTVIVDKDIDINSAVLRAVTTRLQMISLYNV